MLVDIASRTSKGGAVLHLRFVLHPGFRSRKSEVWKKWSELREALYCNLIGEHNQRLKKWFLMEWVSYCSLEKNKSLPFLNRMEGGIGGDNNNEDRQIRCRLLTNYEPEDRELLLDVIDTEINKWSFEELRDLVKAFEKFSSEYIHPDNPVQGYIVIEP